LWVLAGVFFNLELVRSSFVFGNDAPDNSHATLLYLGFECVQVLVEMAESDLGNNGWPGPGDDLVLFLELPEQTLPTRYDGVFVALDEAQLKLAETVWEGLGLFSRERGECVRNIPFGFTAR
jgi:hypothetical protein